METQANRAPVTEQAIHAWLTAHLAEAAGVEPDEIDIRQSFESYGLSSRDAVSLSGDLEDWLGRRLSPTLVWEYPTIEALAKHLVETPSEAKPEMTDASLRAEPEPPHLSAQAAPDDTQEPIAIIGIGCRFPGAEGPTAFWQLLRNGVDAISEVPADRWDVEAFYDPDPTVPGKMNTRWGGFVSGVDQFDPQFFGIAPREAMRMDPQQRLLLEVTWRALEDAGQVPARLAGTRTGVFVGISGNEYGQIQLGTPSLIDAYAGTGNALSIAANRISYVYDFQGPSVAVDTACSSSLVAIHLACRSLWSGESTLALAGGSNLILSPAVTINFTKAGAMAPDGRCKTFDARANGYVRGEGAGMVVLKPLTRALADGDPIYAVIRSTAVNQDGRTNGLMAPNPHAQEAVLREAYRRAGLSTAQVQYIEAHGTGTLLGDPIEANALGAVLAADRPAGNRCAIGSVKTNIGHLEAAAGIAGVIKTALALQHRELPPSLHFEQPNPHILFDELPLYVQRTLTSWPATAGPAIAGVSSFGFGGTNAHIVLAEPPQPGRTREPAATDGRAYLLPLSAQNPEALHLLARSYRDFLTAASTLPGAALPDICYTASLRRGFHDHRLALVGRTPMELVEQLDAFAMGEVRAGMAAGRLIPGHDRKIVFVFPGQGSQWPGMARQLLAQEPVFRAVLEQCDRLIRRYADWSLLERLAPDAPAEESGALTEIDVVQPALFAIQVGLARLWQSWGIAPAAVVGHSMGEVAAAHVAGALSLEDAVRVICHRSRLLKRTSGLGAMVAVGLSMEQARAALTGYEDRLCIAVSNSPTSTVLSGEPEALDELIKKLQSQDIFCRWVKVDVAAHSPYVEPLRPELLQALADLRPQPPAIPLYSTVSGGLAAESLDAAYWGRNLREPVLFSVAVQHLLNDGFSTFVELSPHPLLLSAIQQGMQHSGHNGVVLPSLRRQEDERSVLLGSLANLFSLGYPVDWHGLYPAGGRHIQLPVYPWQRERYWMDAAEPGAGFGWNKARQRRNISRHPLLDRHVALADRPGEHLWESELERRFLPYLADHRVQGAVILPAAAFVEMALAAANEAFGQAIHVVEEVAFKKALILPEEGAQPIQLTVVPDKPGTASFRVFSRQTSEAQPESAWNICVSGTIRLGQAGIGAARPEHPSPQAIQASCSEIINGTPYYQALHEQGLEYGPSFQGIEQLWRRDGEALARLRLPAAVAAEAGAYQVHPAILDACFQTLAATLPAQGIEGASDGLYLPVGLGSLRVYSRPAGQLWSHAILRPGAQHDADTLDGDLFLLDSDGQVVLEALALRVQRVFGAASRAEQNLDDWLYQIQWEPQALPQTEQAAAPDQPGTWLIFAAGEGLGSTLAARLRSYGQTCAMVAPGESYRVPETGHYQLNPSRPEDFRQLLNDAFGPGQPPCRGILHLWSLEARGSEQTDLVSLHAAQSLGCVSVLHLVQAVAQAGWRDTPRLWLLTGGAQAAGPEVGSVAAAQAPLWGLGRTIIHEHPELRCTLVDLDLEPTAYETEALLAELWVDSGENQVALRAAGRYVARLVRLKPPAEQTARAEQIVFRSDGTYLLTGGLGGLGLTVARWMVQKGARHLLLMGRSAASPAAHEALDAMQQAGAEISIAQADVSQPQQVFDALASIDDAMLPLRGVIHAAGILDDGILLQLEQERFRSVLAPKADGAWNLHTLTAEAPLDFFVLFSSAASLLGSPGQGNYAAGSAFLDALAHHRQARGQPALSINWGPWAEVGLAARPDRGGRLADQGIGSIKPQQGLEVLGRLLRQGSAQVGVLPLNWRRWRDADPTVGLSPLLSHIVKGRASTARPAEKVHREGQVSRTALLAAPQDARQTLLEAYLRELGASILGIPAARMDMQQALQDMGLDSLMAIEMKRHIEADLGVTVPIALFLQGPTIRQFAASLMEQVAGGEGAPLPVSVSGTGSSAQTAAAASPEPAAQPSKAHEPVAPEPPPVPVTAGAEPPLQAGQGQPQKVQPGSWLSRLRGRMGRDRS